MSRKETAEKSSTRLWTSTLGTPMLVGRSAFQSTWKGSPVMSLGRSNSSVFVSGSSSDSLVTPFCYKYTLFNRGGGTGGGDDAVN